MNNEEDDDRNAYLPTEEEIRKKCLDIQDSWSKSRQKTRRVIEENSQIIPFISIKDLSLD